MLKHVILTKKKNKGDIRRSGINRESLVKVEWQMSIGKLVIGILVQNLEVLILLGCLKVWSFKSQFVEFITF